MGKTMKAAGGGVEESSKVSLTTSARAMNICIGLHSLRHHSMHRVREALFALDETVLTPTSTELLLTTDAKTRQHTVLPTAEEIAAAKAYIESEQPFDQLD